MKLHEFQKALESDAANRCKEQDVTIKKLHEEVKERDKLVGQLMNRCRVNSMMLGGALCFWCGCKDECRSRQHKPDDSKEENQ